MAAMIDTERRRLISWECRGHLQAATVRFSTSAVGRARADRFCGPTRTHGHVRFCPAIGGQADINSASSDRLGLLGIPVHPASLIRLAGATFMSLASS